MSYSEFSSLASVHPYFHVNEESGDDGDGVHLVVCVHGLVGKDGAHSIICVHRLHGLDQTPRFVKSIGSPLIYNVCKCL